MRTSSRFAVAVHTLAYIAVRKSASLAITSEMIARSVNTHPVVIRRILGALRAAHLVRSQPGTGGGWTLAKKASAITLCQIYHAVENEPLFALHYRAPNARCEVARNMVGILGGHFDEAARAMEGRLERISLAQVVREIGARGLFPSDQPGP